MRELRNLMERALLLSPDGVLDAADFPLDTVRPDAGGGIPFPAPLREIVRSAVRETLELCGGNKSEAARQLQITRPRLMHLLDARTDDTSPGSDDEME